MGARHLPGSVALAAVLLSACTTGAGPAPEAGFPRDRAAQARPVTDVTETVPPAVRSGGPRPVPPQASPTVGEPEPGTPAAPYVAVLDLVDERDDNGLRAPAHADLVRLRVSSNGANARVTIRVAAPLPNPTAEGEVMGVGVDLWRTADASESDYQLFAEGSDGGWFAWRSTSEGLADYEGSFEVGGSSLVFEVPWSALGGARGWYVSVFLDWSESGVVLNQAGSDRAPDRGRARIAA